MSWEQAKASFTQRHNDLVNSTSPSNIDNLVTAMNNAIKQYTDRAGISQNPTSDPAYTTANQKFVALAELEKAYSDLNKEVATSIRNLTASADVQTKLVQIGGLQQDIVKLENELQNVKQDADTSITRQSTVERPREEISFYQGFGAKLGFTKPLKYISVALMIGFGILALFLSGLMLREFFSSGATTNNTYTSMNTGQSVFQYFTDSRFYAVLAGFAFVAAVIGVLSYLGWLGSNLK